MKLVDLAKQTHSTIERGSPEIEIRSTSGLDNAVDGDITFLANPKYTPQIAGTRASAIFLNHGVEIERGDIAILRAKDAYLAYTRSMRLFFPEPMLKAFVHPSAVIDPTAQVDRDVEVRVFGIGTVEAQVLSKIGFQIAGKVVSVAADQGDQVKADALLQNWTTPHNGRSS